MSKNAKAAKVSTPTTAQLLAKAAKTPELYRDKDFKLAALAAVKGQAKVAEADGSATTVKFKPVFNDAWQAEGTLTDCLNGRIGSRTQVIHSILIDAAKRGVLMTSSGIQAALETYLGEGHGAASAHLNTLHGKGSNRSHPCAQPPGFTNGNGPTGPFVEHRTEATGAAWGLSYYACLAAGIKPADMPAWVTKPVKPAKSK